MTINLTNGPPTMSVVGGNGLWSRTVGTYTVECSGDTPLITKMCSMLRSLIIEVVLLATERCILAL